MFRRPSVAVVATLVLTAATLTACGQGCRPGAGGVDGGLDDPALVAIQSRIPPLPAEEIGAAPGFLADGAVYIAVRPEKLQQWLQSLPLGPDVVRDLAKLGNELGFDPRVDDISERLGLAPNAVITATLLRPIGEPVAVLGMLQGGASTPNPFPGIDANTPADVAPFPRPRPEPPQPKPQPPRPDPWPDVPPEPPPIQTWPPPPVPLPPPLPPPPPKPTAAQHDLARAAGALGTHSRIHIPVKNVSAALAPLQRMRPPNPPPETAGLCSQLGPSEFCYGDRDAFLLVRSNDEAIAVDFFYFTTRTGSIADSERATAIKAGLSAPAAQLAVLQGLRGDLVAYADGDAMPGLHTVMSLSQAVDSLHYGGDPLRRHLEATEAITKLRATRRLFAGVRWQVVVDGQTLQSSFQWEPRDEQAREQVTRLLTREAAAASVPTLTGLCDGSLGCLRSAGLPTLRQFEEFATGIYAEPLDAAGRVLDRGAEFAALVVFLETWPNLIGAAQRWPRESGGRMEMAMVGQVLEAVGRIEGFGGSLRSFQVRRNDVSGDFAGYMRMQGQDLALIRSLMGLAGLRFAPVELPQLAAGSKVDQAQLPAEVPANFYLVSDAGKVRVGDREIETGWAVVADSNDRLSWLLGQESSAAVMPAFYFELPDLWQLLAPIDDAQRELNFAQGWLSGRSVRVAGDIVHGTVRIDFQLQKAGPAQP